MEGARARLRQLEGKRRSPARSPERARNSHSSMRDMEPLHIPDGDDAEADGDEETRISETPRRTRPSRIPLHTANKGTAPRPPTRSPAPATPARPPSAHSTRSARSSASARSGGAGVGAKSAVPVRRSPSSGDGKVRARSFWNTWFFKDS